MPEIRHCEVKRCWTSNKAVHFYGAVHAHELANKTNQLIIFIGILLTPFAKIAVPVLSLKGHTVMQYRSNLVLDQGEIGTHGNEAGAEYSGHVS